MNRPSLDELSQQADSGRFTLRAAWIVPDDRPPLRNGVVVVERGRIADIHQRADATAVDLGCVAILPGLVNAHTHLEFSNCDQPISPGASFPDWIRRVVQHRQAAGTETKLALVRGLAELQSNGTAAMGEIATSNWSDEPWSQSLLARRQGVIFREVLGLSHERCLEQQQVAQSFMSKTGGEGDALAGRHLRYGLSPHAPYSVHPQLFHSVIETAVRANGPVAMHLAESPAEIELLQQGTGPFVEMLREFGIWQTGQFPQGPNYQNYLQPLSRVSSGLVIHGNFLDDDDLKFIAHHKQLTLVYCPRTHALFGHPPHPWQKLIGMGGMVALGTDSRASNPDLSLWHELQWLADQHPGVSRHLLLRIASRNGAKSLMLPANWGQLEVDAVAALTLIQLPNDQESSVSNDLFSRRNTLWGALLPAC